MIDACRGDSTLADECLAVGRPATPTTYRSNYHAFAQAAETLNIDPVHLDTFEFIRVLRSLASSGATPDRVNSIATAVSSLLRPIARCHLADDVLFRRFIKQLKQTRPLKRRKPTFDFPAAVARLTDAWRQRTPPRALDLDDALFLLAGFGIMRRSDVARISTSHSTFVDASNAVLFSLASVPADTPMPDAVTSVDVTIEQPKNHAESLAVTFIRGAQDDRPCLVRFLWDYCSRVAALTPLPAPTSGLFIYEPSFKAGRVLGKLSAERIANRIKSALHKHAPDARAAHLTAHSVRSAAISAVLNEHPDLFNLVRRHGRWAGEAVMIEHYARATDARGATQFNDVLWTQADERQIQDAPPPPTTTDATQRPALRRTPSRAVAVRNDDDDDEFEPNWSSDDDDDDDVDWRPT